MATMQIFEETGTSFFASPIMYKYSSRKPLPELCRTKFINHKQFPLKTGQTSCWHTIQWKASASNSVDTKTWTKNQ